MKKINNSQLGLLLPSLKITKKSLLLVMFTFITSCSLDKSTLTPCGCAEIAANGVKDVFLNVEISKEEGAALIKKLEMKLSPCEKKSNQDPVFKNEYEKCYAEKMKK